MQTVQEVLKAVKKEDTMSSTEFLDKCTLDRQQYILAVRSSLNKTKVFFKRNMTAIRTLQQLQPNVAANM